MAIKAWNVEIEGTAHYVELDHGVFSGSRLIQVDDRVVSHTNMDLAPLARTVQFAISRAPAELTISRNGLGYEYALKVNNRLVSQI